VAARLTARPAIILAAGKSLSKAAICESSWLPDVTTLHVLLDALVIGGGGGGIPNFCCSRISPRFEGGMWASFYAASLELLGWLG
jgi:hypothetical protein